MRRFPFGAGPRHAAEREAVERAERAEREAPHATSYPVPGHCSLRVSVPARRVTDLHGICSTARPVNFLAHGLIAAHATPVNEPKLRAGLIAGGILGDFVKGAVPAGWPMALQMGIRLHRRIDAHSNGAVGVRASCNRFPKDLRRLAPVFVDIIADHCLAVAWPDYHPEPLEVFSQRCYATVAPFARRLDARGQRYLNWLVTEDLLAAYQATEAMQKGLLSVTRRLGREHLDPALLEFVASALPQLTADFRDYFPDLLAHGSHWVATNLA